MAGGEEVEGAATVLNGEGDGNRGKRSIVEVADGVH
jgi:hypothetical protein